MAPHRPRNIGRHTGIGLGCVGGQPVAAAHARLRRHDRTRDFVLPAELVDLARRVVEANRAAGRRIAVAESCTGGLVAAAMTEIAGSSGRVRGRLRHLFERGQDQLLGVSERRDRHVRLGLGRRRLGDGAGRARASRAPTSRWRSPALPGPAAAADRKPVGTVVFARAETRADPSEIVADTKKFDDHGRGGVRLQAALCALELLLPDARPVERGARSSNAPIIRRSARSNIWPASASKMRFLKAKSTQKSISVPPAGPAGTSSCCGDI